MRPAGQTLRIARFTVLMQLVMITHAVEMRGDVHRVIHAGLHGMLDLRGDAMRIAQQDVLIKKKVHLDVMHFAGIAVTQ
jgi:hypothetical protein